jgi:hypothetical protein
MAKRYYNKNDPMYYIPPRMRGLATDVGIFGRVASDNILGFLDNYFLGNRFDDDYESTGEQLGTAFREQPIETSKALGTGIYEGAKDIYEDPKGAYDAFTTSLGETIDRLNTPYDQLDLSTEEAQRQRAGDLMIFGEALGAGGVLTKGLVNLGKKQLREKVIQENPGLNEDQVNSIVEDRGYDPTDVEELDRALTETQEILEGTRLGLEEERLARQSTYGDYATPGFGDPLPSIDDGPNVVPTAGFPMQVVPENTVPPNMEVPTIEGFEGIPIVTAGGRVIGSVLDPEEPDVDGNLYGPPDTFDEMNPPEIEDLMEPNLTVDTGQPYRIGDIVLDADMGEGVVDDNGMINYNGIMISPDRPVIGLDIDEVGRDITDEVLDGEPMTTFEDLVRLGLADPDDELARIETLLPQAQVAERVAARREAVAEFLSQRGLSPALAFEALAENNRPILMQELREFVSQRTQQTLPSESDIFYRIESLDSVPDFPDEIIPLPREAIEVDEDEILDAILVDEMEDLLPDDDADVPLTAAQEAALIPATNTNIQGFDTTWLTRPGYGRFTNDANTPVETIPSEPAELAAGDIKLTGENSYLTSRMDTALSELSQSQTKFASLEQLVNTLTKKYGVQPAELQARGIPTSQVEADLLFTNNFTPKPDFDFSKDKVDLNDPFYQNILNKEPFVVRTLGGGDAAYPGEFTKGVTNYKVTIIGLENRPDLLKQGVMDNDHLMGHQLQIDGPTVVHIRTGEFPVQGGGYDRKKTFHLGEIQSQIEKNSRPSRKANDLVRDVAKKMELPEDLEFRIPEGFSINQLANDLQSTADKIRDLRQLKDVIDAYDGGATTEIEKYFANKNLGRPRAVKAFTENTGKTEAEYYRMMGQARFDRMDREINKALDKYNIYKKGSDEVYTSGSLFLDDFEKTLVQTYNKRELNFLDPDETGPGDFLQDLMKFGGENFNASDYGVGSIFTTDRVTRMGIKEALQQAVDTDADFFTLGTGQMAKDMTYGKLSGQIEYYDEIVPKMFTKIMKEIFKDTGIEPPKLRKRKMETLDEYGENVVVKEVLGIELTDELREIFKSKKVQAFKEGGVATLSNLKSLTLEGLKEKVEEEERNRQVKEFADFEYRAELEPQLSYNPIARLGYDPDKHRVVREPSGIAGYREGYSTAQYQKKLTDDPEKAVEYFMRLGLSPEDAERISEDDIITSGNMTSSPVIAHEFTHRGFNLLREERNKDPEAFDKKYGKAAGNILRDSNYYDGLEEYYVEMFDDLDTGFNTSAKFLRKDSEEFPQYTMKSTVQSSPEGPYKDLDSLSSEQAEKRLEQIRAFQDGVLNLDGFRTQGILGLMDAAQDILIEQGEIQAKPRKYYNPSYRKQMQQKQTNSEGGLAILAKEVL